MKITRIIIPVKIYQLFLMRNFQTEFAEQCLQMKVKYLNKKIPSYISLVAFYFGTKESVKQTRKL